MGKWQKSSICFPFLLSAFNTVPRVLNSNDGFLFLPFHKTPFPLMGLWYKSIVSIQMWKAGSPCSSDLCPRGPASPNPTQPQAMAGSSEMLLGDNQAVSLTMQSSQSHCQGLRGPAPPPCRPRSCHLVRPASARLAHQSACPNSVPPTPGAPFSESWMWLSRAVVSAFHSIYESETLSTHVSAFVPSTKAARVCWVQLQSTLLPRLVKYHHFFKQVYIVLWFL